MSLPTTNAEASPAAKIMKRILANTAEVTLVPGVDVFVSEAEVGIEAEGEEEDAVEVEIDVPKKEILTG